ncbi:MAG: Gldg family protein, partial [Myxococcota bacterium]|nr:Gldg family protein [Myxococcota bacterium]
GQLKALAAETAAEQQALVDAPGRKRIGVICAGKGFCPFPDTAPLIPKELEAVLGQKNPIIPQLIPQLKQIQDQMNRFLAGIERDLFRRRGFHIVQVNLDEEVPEDVAGLVLMGPRSALTDWQLYSLDQYVLGGGSLVVLLNAWDVSIMNLDAKQQPRHTQLKKNAANIGDLLGHWGIKPNDDLVVEPQDHDRVLVESPVRTPFGMATSRRHFPYPLVPVLQEMDRESPLVRAVASITLPYATSLTLDESGGHEVRALVKSSPASSTTAEASFPLEPQAQAALVAKSTGDGPHVVAAVAKGKLTSYFAGKDAPEAPKKDEPKEGEEGAEAELPEPERLESGEGRVLVIGSNLGLEVLSKEVIFEGFDLGSLTNGSFDAVSQAPQWGANWQNWWTRIRQVGHTLEGNVPLLDNVLDWSIQNEGLMEVRAKNIRFRPLAQLEEDQQGWVTAAGVVAAPGLFLLFGLLRLGSRRKRRQRLGATS